MWSCWSLLLFSLLVCLPFFVVVVVVFWSNRTSISLGYENICFTTPPCVYEFQIALLYKSKFCSFVIRIVLSKYCPYFVKLVWFLLHSRTMKEIKRDPYSVTFTLSRHPYLNLPSCLAEVNQSLWCNHPQEFNWRGLYKENVFFKKTCQDMHGNSCNDREMNSFLLLV